MNATSIPSDRAPSRAGGETSRQPHDAGRDALADSERQATERQPENFRDRSNGDKVVEIGADVTADPIHGIDPPEKGKRR